MLGFLYLVALFVLLTPGILVTLPKRGSRYMVAATHAAIFGVAMYLLKRNFRAWDDMEGFQASALGGMSASPPRVPKSKPGAAPPKLTPEQLEAKKAARKAAAATAAVAAACAACDASKAAENVQESTMQGSTMQESTMQGSTMQGGSGM